MRDTGVFRPVDEFGRFVIPKELRRMVGIVDSKDSVEMYLIGDNLYCKRKDPESDSICMVRKVDALGRIVIPKEILRTLKYDVSSDHFHILIDDDKIVLVKLARSCIFCGDMNGLLEFQGRMICKRCREKLKAML